MIPVPPSIKPVRAPLVLGGLIHDPGLNRIAMNVGNQLKKVRIIQDDVGAGMVFKD